MAGIRGILAGLAIGSAIISLPAVAQPAQASLTHTVSVTVPPRVRVEVANLRVSTPGLVRNSSVQTKTDGLSLTISATRAWVLTIGTASDIAARKSHLQWSSDSSSGLSTVTNRHVVVATGPTPTVYGQREPVVLTVTAP